MTTSPPDERAAFAALEAQVHAAADHALASGAPTRHRRLAIAGAPVDLTFVGDGVADLWPALAHHPDTDAEPVAELVAFCAPEVGLDRPRPEPPHLEPLGWVDRHPDGTVRARLDATDDGVLLADQERRRHVAVFGASPPWWEAGAPLRGLLHWALAPSGPLLVHAAAVGRPDGAVLLVGKGGSGKSSTAVAAATHGLGYLGDDYCAVTRQPAPTVHHLYATAKLVLPAVDGPGAAVLAHGGEGEKTVTLPVEGGAALVHEAPIRAVVLPRIGGGPDPRLEPLTAAAALRALAPSSLLQRWADPAAELALLADLVRQVPAFTLHLAPDRAANAPVLAELLDSLSDEERGDAPPAAGAPVGGGRR